MLLPDIGPVYAGARGHHRHRPGAGAVVVPTFIITPLAGTNTPMLFGLAAICMVLMTIPVFFLPEVGARALAAR